MWGLCSSWGEGQLHRARPALLMLQVPKAKEIQMALPLPTTSSALENFLKETLPLLSCAIW